MPAQLRSTSAAADFDVSEGRLLYKLADAAAQLSVSKTKLYGLLRNDEIPSILLGGQRYVARDDLVEFVARLRNNAQPFADTAS